MLGREPETAGRLKLPQARAIQAPSSHGRQHTSREDESLEFICDLSDLAAPAAISPIDERTVADQVSVTVVFVEGPLVARNVDSDRPDLDFDRPHSARADEKMILFPATVDVAAEEVPLVCQWQQRRGHLLLPRNASRLLRMTPRECGVQRGPRAVHAHYLGRVASARTNVPPAPLRTQFKATLVDQSPVALDLLSVGFAGSLESAQLSARMV